MISPKPLVSSADHPSSGSLGPTSTKEQGKACPNKKDKYLYILVLRNSYKHKHKITIVKIWLYCHQTCNRITTEISPLLHKFVCFHPRRLIKGYRPEVFYWIKIFEWETTSFSRTTILQREPFLTVFRTVHSSPLLVTKKWDFMLTIILGNYQ